MKNLINALLHFSIIAVLAVGSPIAFAHKGDEYHQAAYKNYPLHHAALHGDSAKVKQILADNPNPDMKTKQGDTALRMAALGNQAETVQLLLAAGADVNAVNESGWTAIMSVASSGSPEVDAANNFGQTALIISAAGNNPLMSKTLANGGANLYAVDGDGQDALDWALKRGDAFTLLIFRVAHSPLFLAVVTDSLSEIQQLLDKGTDINQTDATGWTALMWAAKVGGANMTRLLIKLGADVNVANADGWTALDIALDGGDRGIARILRKAGAEE